MSTVMRSVRARDLHPGNVVCVGHERFEVVERRYTRNGRVWLTTEGHHFPYCISAIDRVRIRVSDAEMNDGVSVMGADTETKPKGTR